MSQKRQEDESLHQEIKKLDEEIQKLCEQKQKIHNKWKKLLLEEDPKKGKVQAKELHELMQKKLMLEVEIDIRVKKKNRLLWSI